MVRRRRKPPSGQRWSIFKCCRPVGFPSTYKGLYDEKNQLSIQYRHGITSNNTNGDEHSLLWLDEDIAFRLDAAESEETMVKIAESVKRK